MLRPTRSPHPSTLLAGVLVAGAGLALAPAAGADVLVTAPADGGPVPTLVAPDGARRALAVVPGTDDDGPDPVVSPDRRFVAVPRGEDTYLLPTDGSAAVQLDAFAGARAGGSAYWWTSPTSVSAFAGGLGELGDVETCGVPTGPCASSRAPGEDRIGTFDTGASVWLRQSVFAPPKGLDRSYDRWTTATAGQVRLVRQRLRRKLRQQLVLRSPGGATRVIRTTRRSALAGNDSYIGYGDLGPRVVVIRTRFRTSLRTRVRRGRTQVRLRYVAGDPVTGLITPGGRIRSLDVRAPAGTSVPFLRAVVPAPGGFLVGLTAKDATGTPLVGLLSPGGAVAAVRRDGRPLTARALGAALGLPASTTGAPTSGQQELDLRPIGYEAATRSDVVAYDESGTRRQVYARVPRDGGAPSLVFRGEPGVQYTTIAW